MPQTWTIEAMLAKLIAFPTISSDSNLPLIDFVENWLAEQGVTATRVPDATGQKAALFARIGPNVPGGVVLSAHTDVVPVKGQDWSSDPFELTERDGRYYGRGTCDMKGFAAVALAMVPRMMAAPLTRPIDIALSYDEEIGCRGAPPMIAALRAAHPPGAITLVGEPTSMKVVTGHKAVAELDVQVHGYEVHSSLLPTGVSAIMYAAELIHWLNLQNAANATAALKLSAEDPAAAFEPPYTTLHSGVIEGGTAHNITARLCRLTIEIRSVPGDTLTARIAALKAEAARLTAEMQAIHPETGFTINVGSAVPGCAPEVDGAAEALARRLTGDNGQHVVAYGTEAGQFQEGGYSTVVCGPGSIDQAHQRDEWVAKDQLLACEQMIGKLITALSD